MVTLGVSGACGRMGMRIIALAKQDAEINVVFGLEASNHQQVGKTLEGVSIVSCLDQLSEVDCLIDFTSPEATIAHLQAVVKHKKSAVIGTTGLTNEQLGQIKAAAQVVPIVFAPNMSVGVNVVFNMLATAAKVLEGYAVTLEEAHHIHKKDAPSGTAKKMVEIINQYGFSLKPESVNAIREGEIVGDHRVVFESDVDRVEISHSAKTRDIFASGALVAAKWVVGKPAGCYSMQDVLFG